jgi:hypothetical protein
LIEKNLNVTDVFGEIAANPEESFLNRCDFSEHNVGACSISGDSPIWTMHPDTDELFYILDGEFEIT